LHHPRYADKRLGPPPSRDGDEQAPGVHFLPQNLLPRMKPLAAVDRRLESRRDGTGVDRGAYDDHGSGLERPDDRGHVVLDRAVALVVADVAADARADLHLLQVEDPGREAGTGSLIVAPRRDFCGVAEPARAPL